MTKRQTVSSLRVAAALLLVTTAGLATAGCARDDRDSAPSARQSLRATSHLIDGQAAAARGDEQAAAASYRRALRIDPNQPAALRLLATVHTQERDFPAALPLWKRYVEATGGSADAFNDLGYCYDLAGFADPAEAAYMHAIAADPVHARSRTNYGLFLARQGRDNEALLQLRNAMEPADAHFNLAVVLEEQGKFRAAKTEYRRALQLQPGLEEAEQRLAQIE